jgi:hypothetical protein
MPDYLVTDPSTGQRIKMTGPAPPSEALIRLALAKVQPLPSHESAVKQTVDPLQAMQKAQTIGPARVGERYQEDLNPSLVGIARKVLGGAQRPPSVAAEDPYGIGAWLKGAGPMPTPIAAEIQAYHGSPHDFEKFLLEKIGTGEGAQAYGHGLYFAENKGVAQNYKEALSGGIKVGDKVIPVNNQSNWFTPESHAASVLQANGMDLDKAIAYAEPRAAAETAKRGTGISRGLQYPEALDLLKKWKAEGLTPESTNAGKMYEVSIKADPDQFLDWDKPLSQQPESVKTKLQPLIDDLLSRPLQPQILDKLKSGTATGHNLYMWLGGERALDDAKVSWPAPMKHPGVASSEALRNEAGIPGIKYLDQGSRGMPEWRVTWKDRVPTRFDTEEQAKAFLAENQSKGRPVVGVEHAPNTSNYVVFDDKLIDILKKYAVAGAVGGSLASLGQQQTEEQK